MHRPSSPAQLSLFAEAEPEASVPVERPVEPSRADDGGAKALYESLNHLLGGRLRSLVLTRNRSRILSARPGDGLDPQGLHLRIHRSFLVAPGPVVKAVAAFAVQAASPSPKGEERRRALAEIRAYFGRHGSASPAAARRRRIVLRPRGLIHDLEEIRDRINREHFDDRLATRITWGRGARGRSPDASRPRSGPRRDPRQAAKRTSTLRLGSYYAEDDLIRIHPALDHPEVPGYVVEAVVYHELLHADLPPEEVNGRRRYHTPEFRRRERLFPHHEDAECWVQENLSRLLLRRARGL